MMTWLLILSYVVLTFVYGPTNACTNFIVTPGASEDGSMILAYNADDYDTYGGLYHYAAKNSSNASRKIWDWETGGYLGKIPEPQVTYNVIGNCNEFGLCMGETTWGGVKELSAAPQKRALLDYGSLLWITLQRSKNAKEAIETMTTLMETYGYASTGETFSIVDKNDAWIMDLIGRGPEKLGAVWVALRIPDGNILVHANRAKITRFPRDDPENCLYSKDVVDLARELGLFSGADDDFNFQAAYDSQLPFEIRFDDTRVFDVYSRFSPDPAFYNTYLDNALGRDFNNIMPIWIIPKRKLSLNEVRERLSSHFEGSSLEFGSHVNGGIFATPYVPSPIVWKYQNSTYVHERPIAVERNGLSFISVIRGWMPPPLQAIVWVAVDDGSTSPRYPVYSCSTAGSKSYIGKGSQDGVVTPILKFDKAKAFWIQNLVANFVYSRWNVAYPVLKTKIDELHEKFSLEIKKMDEDALKAFHNGDVQNAVDMLTNYSVAAGDELQKIWTDFFGYLFVRFRDFIIMGEDETNKACGCHPTYLGIDEVWKKRIVAERGSHYLVSQPPHKENANITSRSSRSFVVFSTLILLLALCLRLWKRSKLAKYNPMKPISSIPLMQAVFARANYGSDRHSQVLRTVSTEGSDYSNSEEFPFKVTRS